jgi:hypothetical protein
LILLVVPIAFVQAPRDLLAHRGIGGYRDNGALLRDDFATSCLDRKVLRPERQLSIRSVPAHTGSGYASKKLNSI